MTVFGEVTGKMLDLIGGAVRQAGVVTVVLLVGASHCIPARSQPLMLQCFNATADGQLKELGMPAGGMRNVRMQTEIQQKTEQCIGARRGPMALTVSERICTV